MAKTAKRTADVSAAPPPAEPKETPGKKRWKVVQARIEQGLCRDCGKPRGDDGTNARCKACAERRREYYADWIARKETGAPSKRRAYAVDRFMMGDLIRRHTMPSPGNADPNEFVTPNGLRITLRCEQTAKPSESAATAPWSTSHWICRLTAATPGRKPQRREFGPVIVSLGPGYKERAPAVIELLSVLVQDAAAAEAQGFSSWCDSVGLSFDSRRAEHLYKLAVKRRDMIQRLLGPKDYAQLRLWLVPRTPAAEV